MEGEHERCRQVQPCDLFSPGRAGELSIKGLDVFVMVV